MGPPFCKVSRMRETEVEGPSDKTQVFGHHPLSHLGSPSQPSVLELTGSQPRSPGAGAGQVPRLPQQCLAVPTGPGQQMGPGAFVPLSKAATRSNVTSGPWAGVRGRVKAPPTLSWASRARGQHGYWDWAGTHQFLRGPLSQTSFPPPSSSPQSYLGALFLS